MGARVAVLADPADLLAEASSSSSSGGYERQRLGDINRLARAIVAGARAESAEALPDRLSELPRHLEAAAGRDAGGALPSSGGDVAFWTNAVVESARTLEGGRPAADGALAALAERRLPPHDR